MHAKKTMVVLQCGEATREFEIAHAERLLRLTKAGWHIPEGSQFEFVEDAIRVKTTARGNNKRKKCTVSGSRETTSAKD